MLPSLAAIVHTLGPFAIKFPDGWPIAGIRWYGLSYLAGFFVGFLLVKRVLRIGRSTLMPEQTGDLAVSIAMGVVLGGRLGYVLFYKPSLLTHFSSHAPFWGALAINEGGMASHGGMIGGVIALIWFARTAPRVISSPNNPSSSATPSVTPSVRGGHDWAHLGDLFAFGAPLGVFFGRLANFVNAELLGRPADSTLPWAVKFPQEMYQWDAMKLTEAQARLLPLMPDSVATRDGDWIGWAIARVQAHDPQVSEILLPMITARHPSQLYAALLEGLLVMAVLLIVWAKPRKPGVVGAIFCTTYGLVRIIGEFFREPDAHLKNAEFAAMNITRGQWLSAILLLAGAALWWYFSRRDTKPMGGWR
jgi:phosphatidylglycerol---prolipoprotein diacylglyceryl transferase